MGEAGGSIPLSSTFVPLARTFVCCTRALTGTAGRSATTAAEISHCRHWWRAQGRSELTLATYAYFVERFLRETGLSVSEVTREALEAHLAQRRTEVKPSSV